MILTFNAFLLSPDTSCVVAPIRDHAFFEQAVLKRQVSHTFLQGAGFAAQVLDLVGIGGSLANHRTRADLRTGRCARGYELMHLATLPMAA